MDFGILIISCEKLREPFRRQNHREKFLIYVGLSLKPFVRSMSRFYRSLKHILLHPHLKSAVAAELLLLTTFPNNLNIFFLFFLRKHFLNLIFCYHLVTLIVYYLMDLLWSYEYSFFLLAIMTSLRPNSNFFFSSFSSNHSEKFLYRFIHSLAVTIGEKISHNNFLK